MEIGSHFTREPGNEASCAIVTTQAESAGESIAEDVTDNSLLCAPLKRSSSSQTPWTDTDDSTRSWLRARPAAVRSATGDTPASFGSGRDPASAPVGGLVIPDSVSPVETVEASHASH